MHRAQGIEDGDAPVPDLYRVGRGQGRFAALEELMRQSLTADERVAAKLLSPLGVADSLLATAAERAQRRAELLER